MTPEKCEENTLKLPKPPNKKKKRKKTVKVNKATTVIEPIEEPSSIFKKRRRFQLNNNYLVSREESEKRLELGCFSLALSLVLACSILTLIYYQSLNVDSPLVLTPNKGQEVNLFKHGIPIQHVALVYQNGFVYDISLNETISPSKNFLLKLSNENSQGYFGHGYFGYSDALGVLHFISSSLTTRKITRYHESYGHDTIPDSGLKTIHEMDRFAHGLQVGNKFWVWGLLYKESYLPDDHFRPKTYIWYTKKHQWKAGPKLKYNIYFYHSGSTGINASHAMIVAKQYRTDGGRLQSFVYDFDLEQWTNYPSVDTEYLYQDWHLIDSCSLATLISKKARKVYLSCLVHKLHSEVNTYQHQYQNSYRILVSYNLAFGSGGAWVFEDQTELSTNSNLYRQLLIATNGILLSFDNVAQQDSVGFTYQNGTWTKLQGSVSINITTDGTFGLLPIFAVPYYVRV